MVRIPKRMPFAVLLVLWLVFAALGMVNLLYRPGLPAGISMNTASGLVSLRLPDGEELRIARAGDIPVSHAADLEMVVDSRAIGDRLCMQTAAGDTLALTLIHRHGWQDLPLKALVGLLFLAIVLWVRGYGEHPGKAAFTIAGALCGLVIIINWAGVAHPVVGWFSMAAFTVSYPLAFAALLVFGFQFPSPTRSPMVLQRMRRATLAIAGLLAAAFFAVALMRFIHPSAASFRTYHQFYRVFRLIMLILLTAALADMLRNTRRQPHRVNRLRFYWLVGGIALGSFPFIFLWSLPQVLGRPPLVPEWLTDIALLVIPLAVAIAIVRYRLFDIEFFLSRSIAYTATASLLVGLYVLAVGSASYLLTREFSLHSPYLASAAAVLVALLFSPVKNRIQQDVDRRFFRIRYSQFTAMRSFLDHVGECHNVPAVLELLRRTLQQALPLRTNRFYHADRLPGFHRRAFRWPPDAHPEAAPQLYLNQRLMSAYEDPAGRAVRTMPPGYAVMVYLGSGWYWILGTKKAGVRFWQEDLQLIEELARAASLSLERFSLIERAIRETTEKEAARRLSEWKSLLVAEVAHNFRSPLNTLTWKLNALCREAAKPESVLQKSREIQQQLQHLQHRVNSLLNLSAIEKGALTPHPAPVAIAALMRRAVEHLHGLMQQRSLQVRFQGAEDLLVLADEVLALQALQNILENACKYSPERSMICVSWQSRERDGMPFVQLEMEDRGPGIPMQDYERLFEPFAPSPAGKDHRRGMHLGLYISRQFLRTMNGDIQVGAAEKGGTRVTVWLPAASPRLKSATGEQRDVQDFHSR